MNNNPQQHIKNIKNRYMNSDKEFVLSSLNRGINRLQKAFPRYGSFLMEFIQNADDAQSNSLKIEILQDAIRVSNDGRIFSKEDVDSICKVGWSSKTPRDYIGYLGVGFKAVFLISECPQIYSGNYRFKFDKNSWADSEHTPWQVIPLWIDEAQIKITGKYKTAFNLTLRDIKLSEKLKEVIKPEHLSDRILLFLRNVKEIEITDTVQNLKRRIVKSKFSETSNYEIYQIQEYENDTLKKQDHWLIFHSICEIPKEVKEDRVTIDWERENVDKREVLIAFKLDGENNLMKEEKGTAHIGVFSFLPLKEIPSGLNFLIQADFLTTPGRGELARECLWNEWLAKEIYNLAVKKCVPAFLKHEKWKMNFTQLLYSSQGGHELFENHIKEPLREYLDNNPDLIAIDGSVIKPNEAVSIKLDVRELIIESDLETLHPGKKILHPDCQISWEIERRVEEGPTFNSDGVSQRMQELINLKAQQNDIEFFKKFYRKLSGYAESTLKSSSLRYQNIILTDEWSLTDTRLIYIKPKSISIPSELKGNFRILHSDLAADSDILEFLRILGVNELTEEHIQDISKREKIPKISKNWPSFSENKKIEYVKLCKELWKKGFDARDLKFLTLKAKSGRWLTPEELMVPTEYGPEYGMEKLIEKDLLDLPLEFVSAEFIEDRNDNGEIKEWHRFFKELGVNKKLEQEKNSVIQRISILTALQFEKSKGRIARELGESEKLGYDIESKSETEERYIEVKGSDRPNPDIFITPNEFRALQNKHDKYFVYVVKDTLRSPSLYVNQGDKLLEISDVKTIIPFNKWWNIAKDEEFRP